MSIITALPTFRQSGAESATMKQRSQGYIQYPYHVDSTKHVYLSHVFPAIQDRLNITVIVKIYACCCQQAGVQDSV